MYTTAEYKIDVENSAFHFACSNRLGRYFFLLLSPLCYTFVFRFLSLSFSPWHSLFGIFLVYFSVCFRYHHWIPTYGIITSSLRKFTYISMLSHSHSKCLFCYACGPNRVIQHVFQLFSDTNAFIFLLWATSLKVCSTKLLCNKA